VEIKNGSDYLGLDDLISKLASEKSLGVSRHLPGDLKAVKKLGDVAAHNRTFIASKNDLDDLKLPFRRALQELLQLAQAAR
jgi:hypothetical protein